MATALPFSTTTTKPGPLAIAAAPMEPEDESDQLPSLDDEQRKQLIHWLRIQDIKIEDLHLLCGNALLLVEIMKAVFPEYVELEDYPPGEKLTLRMRNWENLNERVFSQLGLHQSRRMLQLYINCTQEALELLFFDIMELAEKQRIKQQAKLECQRLNRMRISRKIVPSCMIAPAKRPTPYSQSKRNRASTDGRLRKRQLKMSEVDAKLDKYDLTVKELEQRCQIQAITATTAIANSTKRQSKRGK